MPYDNVRMFRPRQSSPTPKGRLFSVLFPLAVGWLLFNTPLDSQGLTIFMVLGLIYWVFIRRHAIETSFFTRSHYLHTTMGMLLLYIVSFLLLMTMSFALSTVNMVGANSLTAMLSMAVGFVALGYKYVIAAYAVLQAIAGGSGQTPNFPIITPNVDAWA